MAPSAAPVSFIKNGVGTLQLAATHSYYRPDVG